jgi:hypothetical protein
MPIYSQYKLIHVLFLGSEFRGGQVDKLSSTSGLNFSKRGLTTSSWTSLFGSNTKTSRPIN